MELSTILLWFLAIHALIAFIVSISIINCPYRYPSEKLALLLFSWLIPFIGPMVCHYRVGFIGTAKGSSSSGAGFTSSDSGGFFDGGGGDCGGGGGD